MHCNLRKHKQIKKKIFTTLTVPMLNLEKKTLQIKQRNTFTNFTTHAAKKMRCKNRNPGGCTQDNGSFLAHCYIVMAYWDT